MQAQFNTTNSKSPPNQMNFHEAIKKDDVDVVKELLGLKDSLNQSIHRKSDLFKRIFGRSHSKSAGSILDSASTESQLLTDFDEHGMNALHLACLYGRRKIVKLLLTQCDAKLVNTQVHGPNWTFPLHLAAAHDHERITRCLLEAGADIYLLDYQGRTAAEVAERANQKSCARIIRRWNEKQAPQQPTILRHYRKLKRTGSESQVKENDVSLRFASTDNLTKEKVEIELPPGPWDQDNLYKGTGIRRRNRSPLSTIYDKK